MLTCLESSQQMWLKTNSIKRYGLVTRTKNTGKEIKAIILKMKHSYLSSLVYLCGIRTCEKKVLR